MLADLAMTISMEGKPVSYRLSSNLQGALMERIDTRYAEYLHHLPNNPYSLCVTGNNPSVWHLRTLNEEAYEQMIQPLLKPAFQSFVIKNGITVTISKKELKTMTWKELMDEYQNTPCGNQFRLSFQTPTAFKYRGKYWIMPDIRLIFQSLMKKCAIPGSGDLFDEDMLEELVDAYEPNKYELRSATFNLEGIFIPSFTGYMNFRMGGDENICRFTRFLLKLGEYSGIGIKSSIGMGAVSANWNEQK